MHTSDPDKYSATGSHPEAYGQSEVVATTGFATIYKTKEPLYDGGMLIQTDVFIAESSEPGDGQSIYLFGETEVTSFIERDLYPSEYTFYESCSQAIQAVHDALPVHGISEGVAAALQTKLMELISYTRHKLHDEASVEYERKQLGYAQRDFLYALQSAAEALELGAGTGRLDDSAVYTQVWYQRGARGLNDGYDVTYDVCTERLDADDEDHERELAALAEEEAEHGYALWPDEFHHPATVEIHVNPVKRIEFVYTPDIATSKLRHHSRREMVDEAGVVVEVRENESLSIRLDLDPAAPHGIALDIGRGTHDGVAMHTGAMRRTPDLLGAVFDRASATSSHEFTGFDDGMAEQFRNYAERFVVQLDLQHKAMKRQTTKRALAKRAVGQSDETTTKRGRDVYLAATLQ